MRATHSPIRLVLWASLLGKVGGTRSLSRAIWSLVESGWSYMLTALPPYPHIPILSLVLGKAQGQ